MLNDFFISYTSKDRDWAEWIAWHLQEAGYTIVLQAWNFRPGDNFVLKMHEASENSKRTIAVLSSDYLKATFTQPEWAAAFRQDPKGEQGTLLPIHVRECRNELKGLLGPIAYIELVGLDTMTAHQKLLDGVQTSPPRPAMPPPFPGP